MPVLRITASSAAIHLAAFAAGNDFFAPNIPRAFFPAGNTCACRGGADDVDRPEWSVLVGCTCTNSDDAAHNLHLHRFRVSGSGRVLGRSDDLLERTSAPWLSVSGPRRRRAHGVHQRSRSLDIVCAHWRALDVDCTMEESIRRQVHMAHFRFTNRLADDNAAGLRLLMPTCAEFPLRPYTRQLELRLRRRGTEFLGSRAVTVAVGWAIQRCKPYMSVTWQSTAPIVEYLN